MAKEQVTGVNQGTKTADAVTQMTRVFLAGAISLGAIASAMGFFLYPDLIDGGGSTTTKNQPLKILDVVRAISTRGALETIPFNGQTYYAGNTPVFEQPTQYPDFDTTYRTGSTNQPLSIRTSATSTTGLFGTPTANAQATTFSIESIGGATTFSIEPVEFTGLTSQYIYLWYRLAGDRTDRMMTLCLGQTDNTRVFVGTDGSTYTDSKLTNRTTEKSCALLKNMTQGIEEPTEGTVTMAASPVNPGDFGIVRHGRPIARFINGDFQRSRQVNNMNGRYVATRDCCSDPADAGAIERHLGQPGLTGGGNTTFGSGELLPASEVDRFNNANDLDYIEISATDQAGGFGFNAPTRISAATTAPSGSCDNAFAGQPWSYCWSSNLGNGPTTNALEQYLALQFVFGTDGEFLGVKMMGSDGSSLGGSFFMQVKFFHKFPVFKNMFSPIYAGFTPTDPAASPRNPAAIIQLRDTVTTPGTVITQNLCYPEADLDFENSGPVFYFDKDGNAYTDIFLTTRAMTANCQDLAAKALKVTRIASGTVTRDTVTTGTPVRLFRLERSTEALASFFDSDFGGNPFTAYGGIDPLAVVADHDTESGTVTSPRAIMNISGTYQASATSPETTVTASLCVPTATWNTTTALDPVFYFDNTGKPYRDIFLTQALSCNTTSGGGGGGPIRVPIEVE